MTSLHKPSLAAHILREPLNPFPSYRQMRATSPVFYAPEFRSWFVTRYADVQRVVDDPVLFSSEQAIRSRAGEKRSVPTLLWTDPPRHGQLRSLVSQAFNPRTIAALAPRITQIVHAHLDAVAPAGHMDIVRDLANPLPIIVIAELLGIPATDQAQFKHWSDLIVGTARQEKKQAVIEMNAYFLTIVARRRDQPQDDLISALLTAQIEGEHLSDAEILSFCRLLLVAGHETSTNLIGSALLTLDEYPEAMDELRADPSRIPAAVEAVHATSYPSRGCAAWQRLIRSSRAVLSRRARLSLPFSARPIAMRHTSRSRSSSQSPGYRSAIWDSATASTSAWEHPLPAWRQSLL